MDKPEILISIHPQWCEKIFNGEKTIEVRKSRPKIDTPFKVYIYCTKPEIFGELIMCKSDENSKLFGYGKVVGINKWFREPEDELLLGKVIGEFICNKVDAYDADVIACTKWEVNGGEVKEHLRYNAGACLTAEQMFDYSNGKSLYGWHISDLKIYDKPKELGEFKKVCVIKNKDCANCEFYSDYSGTCINYLTRPPQSWCYVEEV